MRGIGRGDLERDKKEKVEDLSCPRVKIRSL